MLITAACIRSHTHHCRVSLSRMCHHFFSHAETTQYQIAVRRQLLYITQRHANRQTSISLGFEVTVPDPDCVMAATASLSQSLEVIEAGSRQPVQEFKPAAPAWPLPGHC